MKKKIKFSLDKFEEGNHDVVTENGQDVRILSTELKSKKGKLIVGIVNDNGNIIPDSWNNENGEYKGLYMLEDENALQPFDKVLARDDIDRAWEINFFGYKTRCYYHCLNGYSYHYCIPYGGNEGLLGTTDAPKGGEK